MTDAERYFLVVAEELNISKAAKRLYVSHQNVSQHIQNLETKYGVQLFVRKPRFMLTAEGKCVAETLWHIQLLEKQLELQLNENKEAFSGEVSFGMPRPRAEILAPTILERFYARYPNVKVHLVEAGSSVLADMVTKGTLDMFFGVQSKKHVNLHYEHLLEEPIYVVIPHNLVLKIFGEDYNSTVKTFTKGIDLKLLSGIPVAMNPPGSFIRGLIDNFARQEGVDLTVAFEGESQMRQLQICHRGLMISFCVQMHLNAVKEMNEMSGQHEKLYVFPINRLNAGNNLYIVTHEDSYIPPYKQYLKTLICEAVNEFELLAIEDFLVPEGP